ncbi:MAG: CotH kinase family protein [Bacteroidales bacterium]|nr:CotH kinase family protein [Bacteroidales bacterium]MBP5373316.1 CotH kinase family protein [Bacteroidales bacterium]
MKANIKFLVLLAAAFLFAACGQKELIPGDNNNGTEQGGGDNGGEDPGNEPGGEDPEPPAGPPERWQDTGADVPVYPTYNPVSSLEDFPRVDVTNAKKTQRLAEGEFTWVTGTARFRDPKGMYKGENDTDYIYDSGVLNCQVRGRGNTSWGAEGGVKNSYKIKLDEHTKIFGMKGDKDWILLADVQDAAFMRSAIGLRLGRLVSMEWQPKYRFVEVYFDGSYGGCYLLVEAKEVDRDNKIPITVVEPGQTDGGYYLELDNKGDYDRYFTSTSFKRKVKFKDPDFGDRNNPDNSADAQAQMNFIQNYWNEMESLLKNKRFDPETGYRSRLEVGSFIDNFIVQELTMNKDGNMRLSTPLAKDADTKIFIPFVWDFDLTLGNYTDLGSGANITSYGTQNGPTGWYIKLVGGDWIGTQPTDKTYYQYLFDDPLFVADLKARWAVVKPRLDNIPAFIDKMVEYNTLAFDHNWSSGKNPRAKKSRESRPTQFTSWSNAVAFVKDFYVQRLAWLDTQIKAL